MREREMGRRIRMDIAKRYYGIAAAVFLLLVPVLFMPVVSYAGSSGKRAEDYTYSITPLLEPFNEYFFVKTDNPDPHSFRFADKATRYGDSGVIEFDCDFYDKPVLCADIKYENAGTGRVDGGYIFYGSKTDGGKVVLEEYSSFLVFENWTEKNISCTLPALKDETDYLIDTYARGNGFFEKMDAVQKGLSSICFYSGSYIRGKLTKPNDYWYISTPGYSDQGVYLNNPYDREDSMSLFASRIYPFRYDSLGFPSVMASVAKRLSPSATYVWNSSSHWLVDVTYNGETRSYGGQGEIKGQGITKKKIKQFFSFGRNRTKYSLDSIRDLLNYYASLKIQDDIPREDALSWKSICDRVNKGAWVRILGSHIVINGKINIQAGSVVYSYFYKSGNGDTFSDASINWWGDLANPKDSWVDGRYVDKYRCYIPGAKFRDHPTSDIVLTNLKMPVVTYESGYRYDESASRYVTVYRNVKTKYKATTVVFTYDSGKDVWKATECADKKCMVYSDIENLVNGGAIDESVLDVVTLTQKEVKKLRVDRNTDKAPEKGFIYDGSVKPGTKYNEAAAHSWVKDGNGIAATCTKNGKQTYVCVVCGKTKTKTIKASGHKWSSWKTVLKPTAVKEGKRTSTCSVCKQTREEAVEKLEPKLKLSPRKKTVKVGKSFVLSAAKLTKGDSVRSVKPDNKKIVFVKRTGKNKYRITGKMRGNTVITVTLASGKKAECIVKVK